MRTLSCDHCGIKFSTSDWRSNRNRRFCSNACRFAHNRGSNHRDYAGGRWLCNTKGYWMISTGDGGRRPEHILKAEAALGRKLKRGEIVHHVDGNKKNNANSNLFICTIKYHAELHARMSYLYQREHFGGAS